MDGSSKEGRHLLASAATHGGGNRNPGPSYTFWDSGNLVGGEKYCTIRRFARIPCWQTMARRLLPHVEATTEAAQKENSR